VVLSKQSVRQLHDARIELLEAVFSMRSVLRCYKQDKSRIQLQESCRSVKDIDMEAEEAMALEAVTRQQLVKI
jgi:hypothetical protein